MHRSVGFVLVVLAAVIFPSFASVGVLGGRVLWADTIVLPGVAEGNVNNVVPFGLGSPYFAPEITGRYQQVYGAGSFLPFGVSTITDLAFRLDKDDTTAPGSSTLSNVVIALGITAKSVDGLSQTFANNLTGGATTVYSGALSFSWSASSGLQRPFDFHIPLQQAFQYDPSIGNLLLDITIIGGNTPSSSTPALDAAQGTDSVSRVGVISSATNGWQTSVGTADTFGLVTEFTAASVPEPSSLLLAGLGFVGLIAWTWRRPARPGSRARKVDAVGIHILDNWLVSPCAMATPQTLNRSSRAR